MPINVIPPQNQYSNIGPFRMWCQRVIPLVYDDSLSYYEVLCKLVDYLNKVANDLQLMGGDITKLYTAMAQLQDYINNYFDNLDVQQEINSKLDEMAKSGALTALIEPLLPDIIAKWLQDNITPTTPVVDKTLTISGAAADALVTGDFIRDLEKFSLQTVDTVLNPAEDINTYTTPGAWYANNNATPINWPVANAGGRLVVFATSQSVTSETLQVVALRDDNVIYYRMGITNGWNPWTTLVTTEDAKNYMQTYNTALSPTADLNTMTAPGMWYANNNNVPANWPDTKLGGRLAVFATSQNVTSQTLQIVAIRNDNIIYYRVGISNGWNPWIKILDSKDFTPESSSVSLFTKIGCCGDSFTIGYLYNKTDSPNYDPNYPPDGSYPQVSWPTVMNRLYGCGSVPFAKAGVTTGRYIAEVLPSVISAEPQQLYLMCLGLNDRTQQVPMGVEADLDNKPATETFLGNYGEIIRQIKAHAPNSKFILCKSFWVLNATSHSVSNYYNYISEAVEIMSKHYGFPYLETLNDPFFCSDGYTDGQKGFHPTAPLYAGMAKRIGELVGNIVFNNPTYFYNFYIPD